MTKKRNYKKKELPKNIKKIKNHQLVPVIHCPLFSKIETKAMSSAVQTPTATVDTIWSSIYTEANKHKQVEVTPSSTANDVTLSHSASTTTGQDFQNSQHHHGNVLILGEESTGKFSLTQMLANKATQQNKDTMATALKYTGA